jgi:hypothetical protein
MLTTNHLVAAMFVMLALQTTYGARFVGRHLGGTKPFLIPLSEIIVYHMKASHNSLCVFILVHAFINTLRRVNQKCNMDGAEVWIVIICPPTGQEQVV